MGTKDIILISGIIIACIWMMICVFLEGKGRKYVIIAGVVLDVILFAVSRNSGLLLAGVLGGLACGLIPMLISGRKYKRAVNEMHGVKNWTVVSLLFFVMIFMVISLAYPGVEITWGQ